MSALDWPPDATLVLRAIAHYTRADIESQRSIAGAAIREALEDGPPVATVVRTRKAVVARGAVAKRAIESQDWPALVRWARREAERGGAK